MKKKSLYLFLISFPLLACASHTDKPTPQTIQGSWVYVNDTGVRVDGFTFNPDGSYSYARLVVTSSSSANAELETGIYKDDGAAVTFTPQKWTCPGPDPIVTVGRTFNSAGSLVFSFSSGVITLKPNNAPPSESSTIAYGCFGKGTFTRAPLAPVSN